jgi:hypothetical protein
MRHVPRTVDSSVTRRDRLCPGARDMGGVIQGNDARRSVAEVLGAITQVDVHRFGPGFADFVAVQTYLRRQLAQRPRAFYQYTPWAEPTPLGAAGVFGTLHFANGSAGIFEAAGDYLCVQDTSGVHWWLRLAPLDIWPLQ